MTSPNAAPRSWLYVPADRIELLAKALAGPADAVVIDLEDAVPPPAKQAARAALADAIPAEHDKPVWVRINHPLGPWGADDIATVAALAVDGVRLPKCEQPAVVADAAGVLGKPVHVLIESALGVQNAAALARASDLVAGIALGEADLLADLGGTDASALEYARGHLIVSARAAGLPAPVMSVFTNVSDLDGLAEDSRRARAAGFFGRTVVHPRQVPVVNAAFTPSAKEVAEARRVLAALDTSLADGRGVVVDERGRFIDAAVVRQARHIIALATRNPDLSA